MKRLTTDKSSNNTETMLNYAYAKDGYVHLSYADGEEDIRLTEYCSRLAQRKGCEFGTEENILNGDTCRECDCEVAIINVLAIQAAELRERLKKYEDTGLSPEEICSMRTAYDENQVPYMIEATGREAVHLYGLLQAEAEGRLIVPPCKVGDTLYHASCAFNRVDEYTVLSISILLSPNVSRMEINAVNHRGAVLPFDVSDFGDTIFLTREAAEKALEKV